MKFDLTTIGINIGLVVSGFFGSLITARKDKSLKQQAISVITGTMGANYLTPFLIEWLSLTGHSTYGLAFLVGFGGLKTVELVYSKLFE